jgi:hypothetical protein
MMMVNTYSTIVILSISLVDFSKFKAVLIILFNIRFIFSFASESKIAGCLKMEGEFRSLKCDNQLLYSNHIFCIITGMLVDA